MPEQRTQHRIRGGKVLPFEQTGEFFLRRGMFKQDHNNLVDAIAYYRRALRREPDNAEYKLALAEVLTQMNRFEESNRVLLASFSGPGERPSEGFFGMGCNFIGLQEYANARYSFERYTVIDPEGEFVDEALDMLDALEDEELFQEIFYARDKISPEAAGAAAFGKDYIERGDYRGAITVLEEASGRFPNVSYIENNLALAYFCARKFDKATERVREILQRDPNNIQAHCNLALFCNAAKEKEAVQKEIAFILSANTDDADDLNRMTVTLMELGQHEDALKLLKRLFQLLPYDVGVTHRLAICLYELGEFKQATALYDRLCKLDPEDSVARFYRGMCFAAAAGAPKRKGLPLTYQVPYDEIVQRIHQLNDYAKLPHEKLKAAWGADERFGTLVQWALELSDVGVKRAMLNLLGTFGDTKAEQVLRGFALMRAQPDELKNETMIQLERMHAKEPYYGYMGGQLVKSRVRSVASIDRDLPKGYRDILSTCLSSMEDERDETCIAAASKLFERYLAGLDGYPQVRGVQVFALAAALECIACRECDVRVTKSSLCSKYGISLLRLNNAIGKILNAIGSGKAEQ
ncbi:MAG: tetratricopeptide repeat protein [Bacillota bacterium]